MLSTQPDPSPPPITPVLIHTGKGGGDGGRWTREGSKIPTWLTVSLLNTPVKTTFRVWCFYSYLVHGAHHSTVTQSEIKTFTYGDAVKRQACELNCGVVINLQFFLQINKVIALVLFWKPHISWFRKVNERLSCKIKKNSGTVCYTTIGPENKQ